MEQRSAGKRRLSCGHIDDMYDGSEKQRQCFENFDQPRALPSSASVDDTFISQYLSLGVERMDLQADQQSNRPIRNCHLPQVSLEKDDFSSPVGLCYFAKPASTNSTFGDARSGVRAESRRCRRSLTSGRISGLSRSGLVDRLSKKNDHHHLANGVESLFDDQRILRGNTAFENVSSIGTSTVDSRTSFGESERMNEVNIDSLEQVDETALVSSTSVVERNARIIKWLCSIKRASVDDDTAD